MDRLLSLRQHSNTTVRSDCQQCVGDPEKYLERYYNRSRSVHESYQLKSSTRLESATNNADHNTPSPKKGTREFQIWKDPKTGKTYYKWTTDDGYPILSDFSPDSHSAS